MGRCSIAEGLAGSHKGGKMPLRSVAGALEKAPLSCKALVTWLAGCCRFCLRRTFSVLLRHLVPGSFLQGPRASLERQAASRKQPGEHALYRCHIWPWLWLLWDHRYPQGRQLRPENLPCVQMSCRSVGSIHNCKLMCV